MPDHRHGFSIVNLAKIDSYIGTKEEGMERMRCLVDAYRSKHGLRKLTAHEDSVLAGLGDIESPPDVLGDSSSDTELSSATAIATGGEDVDSDEKHHKDIVEDSGMAPDQFDAGSKPSALLRLGLLMYRTFLERLREPMSTYVHVVQTIFLAIVVGVIYLRIGDNHDRKSIDVRAGSFFLSLSGG
jgi:hypothetical protein